MAKYIDREEFLEDAEERYCLQCRGAGKDYNGLKCRACWVDDMCGDIIDAPTIDAVPVSELEKLRDYLYEEDLIFMRGLAELNKLIANYCAEGKRKRGARGVE